jgi:hypothetical protein
VSFCAKQPCTGITARSDAQLTCTLPAGFGAGQAVVLTVSILSSADFLSSDSGQRSRTLL